MLTLTYYHRPGCSLCPPFLKTVLEVVRYLPEKSAVLSQINIDEDVLACEKYNDKIPVLEINGKLIFNYHIDKKTLEKLIVELLRG